MRKAPSLFSQAPLLATAMLLALMAAAPAHAQDAPLAITVLSPTQSESAHGDILFSLEASAAPELCYVTIDGASHMLSAESPMVFSLARTLQDGVHALDYACRREGQVARASAALLVDSEPPVITQATLERGQGGEAMALVVATDEVARCRYGAHDAQFAGLPESMGAAYGLRAHAQLPAPAQGEDAYFVRCEDVYGNAMRASLEVPRSRDAQGIFSATGLVVEQAGAAQERPRTLLVALAAVAVALLGCGVGFSAGRQRLAGLSDRFVRAAKERAAPARHTAHAAHAAVHATPPAHAHPLAQHTLPHTHAAHHGLDAHPARHAHPHSHAHASHPAPSQPSPSERIPGLLAGAERDIDAKEYAPALRAYRVAVAALERDEGLRARLGEQAHRVYRKLLLFRALERARHALDARQADAANAALHEARAHAQELGNDGGALARGAEEAFTRFVRELNALEIERAEKY